MVLILVFQTNLNNGMKIGVVKEIKDREQRVALTPQGACVLAGAGHSIIVEQGAGLGSGFSDYEYTTAGCVIATVADAWNSELVLKVKEPEAAEYHHFGGQIIFTFFHLAGVAQQLTTALLETKSTALAYETLEDKQGRLPLLAPMSAVAGNMATLMGSYYLAAFNSGRGTQLGTVLGEPYGKVVVIGDGVVGQHAARVASATGAAVCIAGIDPAREEPLRQKISMDIRFFLSTPESIAAEIRDADLVIGAVLVSGAKAPHVISEPMVKSMPRGSVIVDVSIDQGGCIETSRPTTHSDPVFEKHGVIHYCVTNMPGAYPRTSTLALTRATMPYVKRLADNGLTEVAADIGFSEAVNTYQGYLTCKPVAESFGMLSEYKPFPSSFDKAS